ncbi:MAG: ABC transporter ATP-binding protein [Enhydrobacter sp.]|nr:MAG: ABC transporter ATP-binding protein [Enhydrobacter sp.]
MTGLAASNLTVTRDGATLLSGLSLALPSTGSVALIGPNGAGKSTLLKMLAGLETPDSGTVRVGGRELSALSRRDRARRIGFLPQHFEPHWDLSVLELVDLAAQRADVLPPGALAGAMAAHELDDLGHRRWSTLSGGERARVLLAMVLVVDPPILLADEPAAALDIRHRLDVMKALAERGRSHLSVVVVHDLDLAFRFFERVIVVDRGRIVADGPAHRAIELPELDVAFGVRFERISTEDGWSLRARR